MDFVRQVGDRFCEWMRSLPQSTAAQVHIVCDFDGDGLPAGAILWRALRAAGFEHTSVECRRKGESAWGPEIAGRLRERAETEGIDALIVTDLGSRDGDIYRPAA